MDLGGATSVQVPREFLAVVLAGFGNELLPLTSNYGEEPCPKALLHIANKPMLDYTLSWIEHSAIHDVLLICPVSHRQAISHYIHSDTSAPSLRIDLQTYDESPDTSTGTCTLLRHFSNRIQGDFVILPVDFVPPASLPLTVLLDKFRNEAAVDGLIATACWFEAHHPDKGTIPDEWESLSPRVSIVWDENSGTLLHIDTPDDVEKNSEEIELRIALLSKYPRTKMSSKFQDSHVYVCRRSVLDTLLEKPHFDSFREEFIPWLCKLQYQGAKREKYTRVLKIATNTSSQNMALKHSTLRFLHQDSKLTPPYNQDYESSQGNGAEPTASASLRIGLIIHRANEGFVARANTLPSLLELNRRLLTQVSYSLPTDPKNRSLIDQKAQISMDSIIGDSTQVEERSSIKKSVIGKHCVIGKMAKIIGCVILDHCVIADGAKLDGCILGKNTKVGVKSELVRCVTQAGYEVGPGETYKNEKLDISDWTAASEDESETTSGDEGTEGTTESEGNDSGNTTQSASGAGN